MKQVLKKYWWILVIIIGLIVGVQAITQKNTPANGKLNKTITVKPHDLTESLTLAGKVEAEEHVTLRFKTSGKLAWVGVKTGDTVAKYQNVASLDKRDVQKELEKELNTYMSERWDFEQTKSDYKDSILTDSIKRILEKSQFDLNNSVLSVEIDHLAVEYATLISPIAGIVTGIASPYAGVFVTPAQAEFEIVNPDTIFLSVNADQNEVTKLTASMSADIVFDAYDDDEPIQARVESIGFAPKAGESSIVYEIKIPLMQNTNYKYRIGMTADASFVTQQKTNAIAVPSTAIKQESGETYVYLKKANRKVKTVVEVGDEWDDETEILTGVSEGDIVYEY